MRRLRPGLVVLGVLGVLAAALSACGRGEVWPDDLLPVAEPDLGNVEAVVRDQLGEARRQLDDLLEHGRGEPGELARAFGHLGSLYHSYRLEAAACYENALRLDPKSFRWAYQLGLFEQENGRLDEAALAFERALELDPPNPAARLHRAEVALAAADPRTAAELVAGLEDDERFAAAAHLVLGRAFLALGDLEPAVGHLEHALELEPAAADVHHALGTALRRLGRLDEAKAHLVYEGTGQVLYPDPLAERIEGLARSSGSFMRRGNKALMAGEVDAAVEAYRGAVEAAPEDAEPRRNLALALARRGDAAEALRQLDQALESHPDDLRLRFDRANTLRTLGDNEGAVAAFRRTLEIDPDHVAARFNLANVLGEMGRWQEAAEELDGVLRREPDHPRARYLAAMALHYQGRSAEALVALREVLRQDLPADAAAKAWDQLAELAWRQGRRREAVEAFRRAAELEPLSSEAQTKLANTLQLLGERTEAAERFARAVELDPKNTTARLSEASLRILAGDYALAVERLGEALVQVPGDVGLVHLLARLLATCPDAALRDGGRALALAQQAYTAKPSLEHAATIAMAMAEQGRFGEAAAWQKGLIDQGRGRLPPAVLAQLEAHLRLYESGRAVRIETAGAPGS